MVSVMDLFVARDAFELQELGNRVEMLWSGGQMAEVTRVLGFLVLCLGVRRPCDDDNYNWQTAC